MQLLQYGNWKPFHSLLLNYLLDLSLLDATNSNSHLDGRYVAKVLNEDEYKGNFSNILWSS